MQRLEVSGVVRLIHRSLGVKGLISLSTTSKRGYQRPNDSPSPNSCLQHSVSLFRLVRLHINPVFSLFKAYWLCDAPTGLTFNNCTLCPHCIYVFCIYLRTNSGLCHLQHKLIGFYSRDAKCLLRGPSWVFK